MGYEHGVGGLTEAAVSMAFQECLAPGGSPVFLCQCLSNSQHTLRLRLSTGQIVGTYLNNVHVSCQSIRLQRAGRAMSAQYCVPGTWYTALHLRSLVSEPAKK